MGRPKKTFLSDSPLTGRFQRGNTIYKGGLTAPNPMGRNQYNMGSAKKLQVVGNPGANIHKLSSYSPAARRKIMNVKNWAKRSPKIDNPEAFTMAAKKRMGLVK